MFHEGDLQSGIALAIQQGKLVVCFVRDESNESREWQSEWLANKQVSTTLQTKAIVLRIQAGSQEAGFLSAFCTIERVPAVIVIYNGQLRENIIQGVERSEFESRLRSALGADEPAEAPSQESEASQAAPFTEIPPEFPSTALPDPPSEPVDPRREAIEARRRELAAERSRVESEAASSPPAPSKDKGKGKAPASDPSNPSSPPTSDHKPRSDWIAAQRARNQANRAERERILARIEADKVERAARREEERRALRATTGPSESTEDTNASVPTTAKPHRVGKSYDSCLVTVRLPSGTQARQSFPATATPAADLRPWLDELLKDDQQTRRAPAYALKRHVPPAPAKSLSAAEEQQSLGDLEMPPAASVVVSLVQGGASAYAAVPVAAGGGVLAWIASLFAGLWAAIVGVFGRIFGGFGGSGTVDPQASTAPPQPEGQRDEAKSEGKATGISVRTLADQRREREKDGKEGQTWYNGNQTSFQPKPKDDGKDE